MYIIHFIIAIVDFDIRVITLLLLYEKRSKLLRLKIRFENSTIIGIYIALRLVVVEIRLLMLYPIYI